MSKNHNYMVDRIVDFASNIIEKANEAYFFNNKCKVVASILEENITQMIDINKKNPIDKQNLQIIFDNLSSLSQKIDEIKDKKVLWQYILEKQSIQKVINEINHHMQNIYITLDKSGVQNPSKLPTNNLYEDYTRIDEFLEQSQRLIQERRNEVNDYLKECYEDYMLSNDNSLDEENINELNNNPSYKLNKDDFVQGKKCEYSNAAFDYYSGHRIKDNKEVTILKLKDKSIFKRLLSVLIKINHPNVESFIGAYIENTNVTIITNRSGISLDNYLYQHKSKDNYLLKPGDRTILAFKIAQAMSHLHSRSIVHRNLNDLNVFIPQSTEPNSEISPVVVGFRNSRLLPSNPTMGLSNANMKNSDYSQSPFYAPEFSDSHTYDEKVDVFSYSEILFELLTGQPPFKTLQAYEIDQKLKDKERPPLPKETPEELKELISLCWEHDPKLRISFDKVIEIMLEKRIIFPQDKENQSIVDDFYQRNKIKSNSAKDCIKTIEVIKKDIGTAYQYRFELIRSRSILQTYQNLLRESEYSTKESICEEENKKLIQMNEILNQLKKVVSKLSFENWDEKSSKIKISDFTNQITELMKNVYQIMIELGFDKDQIVCYEENDNDLVFDYRELKSYYNEKFGFCNRKNKEISDFMKKRNLIGEVSQKALKERLKDLFSPFKRFEIDYNEIKQVSSVFKSDLSEVFYGNDNKNNKKVAIKVISEKYLSEGEKSLILLRREIGYLTRLKHKYIADFSGFALPKGSNQVWLISDFIPDGSLKNKIDKQVLLTGTDNTKIAFKIAEVMNYLHSKRILYLDIKSTNFMMKGNKTPKMIDFGFACSDNDCQKMKDKKIGTDNYRAPEIYTGQNYDYKADVFSYSMLLYELYTAFCPYSECLYTEDIKKKIINGVDLDFDDDASQGLIDLIKSGFSKNPRDRPNFEEIMNTMIRETIVFPDADKEKMEKFYKKKQKEHKFLARTASAPSTFSFATIT